MFYLLEADADPGALGRVLSQHASLGGAIAAQAVHVARAEKIGTTPPAMRIVEARREFPAGAILRSGDATPSDSVA